MYPTYLDDSDEHEREMALNAGLELLACADELWYFGSIISEGMKEEMLQAAILGIPVKKKIV